MEYEHHRHHHHHHRAPLSAPELADITITFKESTMASIAGSNVPVIALTATLPTTRVDGTAAALSEIASITFLRDSGSGPSPLGSPVAGPFSGPTVSASDASPATGTDTYSFFATDTAGTQGVTSPPVSVTVAGAQPLAQLSAGTMTAVSNAGTGTGGTGVAPTITTQPVAASVALGSPASFSVVAAGDSPLSYQWSENGVPITGDTSASVTTAPTVAADNQAAFTVTVTNASGSVTSAPAILTAT
jgi:hypothetical protein